VGGASDGECNEERGLARERDHIPAALRTLATPSWLTDLVALRLHRLRDDLNDVPCVIGPTAKRLCALSPRFTLTEKSSGSFTLRSTR
jgi:hypothetical protein